jgi:uncharacterized membrane protein (DUF2068 family)
VRTQSAAVLPAQRTGDSVGWPQMARETHRGLLLIGALKLVKALGLFIVGLGLLSLLHRNAAEVVGHVVGFFRLDAHTRLIDELLAKIAGIDHRTMRRLGVGTLLYAIVFAIEGVGLLLGKTWAEYMTAGVTVSFLPIEVYELVEHPSVPKVLLLLINVAVVLYLVLQIRRRRADEQLAAQTHSTVPSP